jgi:diazepam-binding inhibitor (GABA receptor modulator, acyl-CoA-binding protein)
MSNADPVLRKQFDQAVSQSKVLSERPDNASLLKLYALYKQATDGDVEDEKPGSMDFVALAKWNARSELRGTGAEDAMRKYIALVESLGG